MPFVAAADLLCLRRQLPLFVVSSSLSHHYFIKYFARHWFARPLALLRHFQPPPPSSFISVSRRFISRRHHFIGWFIFSHHFRDYARVCGGAERLFSPPPFQPLRRCVIFDAIFRHHCRLTPPTSRHRLFHADVSPFFFDIYQPFHYMPPPLLPFSPPCS